MKIKILLEYPIAVYKHNWKAGREISGCFWALISPITFMADMAVLKSYGISFEKCKTEIENFINRELHAKTITA